jgi:hypothetical protein
MAGQLKPLQRHWHNLGGGDIICRDGFGLNGIHFQLLITFFSGLRGAKGCPFLTDAQSIELALQRSNKSPPPSC